MNQAVDNSPLTAEKKDCVSTKHLCIIQLTRMGDIIQTMQGASGIKERETDIFTTIVVRENFGGPLKFLLEKTFHRVITIKYENLWDDNIEKIKKNTNLLLDSIQHYPIDALVNLSYCTPSKYLSFLLNAKHKLGPYMDRNLNEIIPDKWSQYLYANVLTGDYNPFSLVDLFSSIIGSKKNRPRVIIQEKKSNSLVIHPFTSQTRKTWKISKWIEVIYKILKETSYKIYLVGGTSDIDRAKKILAHPLITSFSDKMENWVGDKSIQNVFDLLERANLFIGHDSIVGHLAALQQTPSVIVILGNARPMETSPYNPNAFILVPKIDCFPCQLQKKCDVYLCHQDISYYALLHVALKILSHGVNISYEDILRDSSEFYFVKTRVYKSSFSETSKYNLKKISKDSLTSNDVFKIFYRIAWQYQLNRLEEHTSFPKITKEIAQRLTIALQGLTHIFELCEFAQKYIRYILEEVAKETPNISTIKNYSNKIDEIDNLLKIVSRTSPELTPLVNYSIVSKSNLEGSNVVHLSESAYVSYENLKNLSSIIYELAQKSLDRGPFKEKAKRDINA